MRFRVEIEVGSATQRIRGIAAALPREAAVAVRDTASDTRDSLRSAAPRDTGELAAGLALRQEGQTATVRSTARSADGYRYTAVSRFGHRPASPDRIYPQRGRALGPMLGGRFFTSVRRYHPATDWAARPLAGARFALVRAARRMVGRL